MSSDKIFKEFMKASDGDIEIIQEAIGGVLTQNPDAVSISSKEVVKKIKEIMSGKNELSYIVTFFGDKEVNIHKLVENKVKDGTLKKARSIDLNKTATYNPETHVAIEKFRCRNAKETLDEWDNSFILIDNQQKLLSWVYENLEEITEGLETLAGQLEEHE